MLLSCTQERISHASYVFTHTSYMHDLLSYATHRMYTVCVLLLAQPTGLWNFSIVTNWCIPKIVITK